MKNIVILGSTGSIGTQTIDVLDSIEAQVCAISVNTNIQRAEQQARALHPSLVAVYNEEKAKERIDMVPKKNPFKLKKVNE